MIFNDYLSSQYSIPNTQYPILNTQYPILTTQYSILTAQYSLMRQLLSLLRQQPQDETARTRRILTPQVPEAALDYCVELSKRYSFRLRISAPRASKLGDFRYLPDSKLCLISVNRDLSPQAFLITYLHEAAHAAVFRQLGRSPRPHGIEWQRQFRQLAQPLLRPDVFVPEVLLAFSHYLQKPSATSAGHPGLAQALRLQQAKPQALLHELPEGERFRLRRRTFVKVGRKRTRALCRDERNQRLYLIPEMASVERIA
jgi:SprT protein